MGDEQQVVESEQRMVVQAGWLGTRHVEHA